MADVRVVFTPGWETTVATAAAPKVAALAELVADAQRRAIPVSTDGSYGRSPGYARDRITVWEDHDELGRVWAVGTDATTPDGVPYPLILDVGSVAHVIESHGDYPLRNRRTGQVFGKRVMHPGTQPTYWCRGSLQAVVGKEF